jgi:CRP/FNR family transcriptional regulator, cyclic AMP receptor protein
VPESVSEMLGHVELFAGLGEDELREIASKSVVMVYPAGARVAVQGGPTAGFHLILRGSATVDVNGVARPPLGEGGYFGEMSLLDGAPPSATVTAGPDGMRTSVLSQLAFTPILDAHPDMSRHIIGVLARRLRALEASRQG